ncbi:hypothetical protein [Chitinophaga sp. S165]|uniref:hypothetical protein n=1 Tax=Chitinophaga sp. S165 TaxID=2135462 RepID=UPI000D716EBB|nr:hypothetical protein [Chitinophaga sp. S165]
MSCQNGINGKSQKPQTQNLDTTKVSRYTVDQQLNGLLDSLRYCYVRNIKNSEDRLLEFYKKKPEDFKEDSLVYYTAVTSFFNADSTILKKILVFQGDSSRCGWIYSPKPYSSIAREWEGHFNKEMGSKVLIYAYLMGACGNDKNIPNDPDLIEEIFNKIQLTDFSHWLDAHQTLNKMELCRKFKEEKL